MSTLNISFSQSKSRLVLGIDPGSRITGFGLLEVAGNRGSYLSSGVIKTDHQQGALGKIFSELAALIEQYQPNEVAIEQVFMHANVNSAIKLGQARGAAIAAAERSGLRISEYTARQVKLAVVGYGNAEKHQVQQMVKLLLKLPQLPSTDEADALAVAICHAHSRQGT